MGMGMGMGMNGGQQQQQGRPYQRPGDWVCTQCNDLQFARNSQCRQCQAPKPSGVGDRPGDWHCASCGDLQFAYRTNCRKCGVEKAEEEGGDLKEEAQPMA